MLRRVMLAFGFVLALGMSGHVWAQSPGAQTLGLLTPPFQGYWMGVDPLDGGDSRRSLVRLKNGKYMLAGRDSVFTLCDSTDRGFISFNDGTVISGTVMRTDNLLIACANTASVTLRARYELVAPGVMLEETTTLEGDPVTQIIFHRVGVN